MPVKIQLDLETQKAMASADVLEARLRKVSAAAASIFQKASPENQANLLKAYGIYTGEGGHVLQSNAYLAQAARMASKMGSAFAPQTTLSPTILAQGAKQLMAMGALTFPAGHILASEKMLAKGAQELMKMGPLQTGGINWKMMGMGGAAGLFSPWIGSRLMNQAMGGGGGKGGSGGIASALLGGGAMGFGEFYLLISAVKRAADLIGHEFVDAIHRGSQALLKAAETGTSVGQLAHMNLAFQAIGLPADAASKLLAQGQFMRGQKFTSSAVEGAAMMGVGRGILSKEEAQGIMNLSNEIADAWKRTAFAARVTAATARDLFGANLGMGELESNWKAFWSEITAVFSPVIQAGEVLISMFLKIETVVVALTNVIVNLALFNASGTKKSFEGLKAITSGGGMGDVFNKQAIGGSGGRPESGWERMGLIVHGGIGQVDYARQTAQNTKRIADAITGKSGYGPTKIMGTREHTGAQAFHLP